jgi:hypothetical protein
MPTRPVDLNNIKGRIAEALVESIFRRAEFKMTRFGRESDLRSVISHSSMKKFAGFIWLLLFVTGCAAARIYEGPPRDPSEVAVVHDDRRLYGFVNRNVHTVSIDGEEHRRFGSKIELLPGDHTLGILFADVIFGLARWAKTLCFVKFHAEAGHEYKIDSEIGRGDTWWIWLVDQQTGARCDCLYEPANGKPEPDSSS